MLATLVDTDAYYPDFDPNRRNTLMLIKQSELINTYS